MKRGLFINASISRYPSNREGFALIATISVMVLLVMVALAMLSLSAIELRSSQQGDAEAVAKANARVALMLAIGELQKEAGPDQRITANAGIIADDESGASPDQARFDGRTVAAGFMHPHWLGVWNSWDNWMNSTGFENTYDRGRTSRFRRFLVSHPSPDVLKNIEEATSSSSGLEMVKVVGKGTLGKGKNGGEGYVLVPMVRTVGNNNGGFAWWVSGENQRAMATHYVDSEAPSGTIASAANRLADQPAAGVDWVEDLDGYPTNEEDYKRSVTMQTLGVVAQNKIFAEALKTRYHDLTAYSVGLPVNVRDGQLKRDMNTLLELPQLPAEYGSFRRGQQGGDIQSIRSFNGDMGDLGNLVYSQNRSLASWYKLHQFYQLAAGGAGYGEEVSADQKGAPFHQGVWWNGNSPQISFNWSEDNVDRFGWGRTPIVARMMFIFSLTRKASTSKPGTYDFSMNYSPVITMWNPYNVTMHAPPFWIQFTPGALEYKTWLNGTLKGDWEQLDRAGGGGLFSIYGRNSASDGGPIVLRPGETRIFSAKAGGAVSGARVIVTPGYDPPTAGGGFDVPLGRVKELKGTDNVELAMRLGWKRYDHAGQYQHYLTVRNAYTGEKQRFNEMAANPVEPSKAILIIDESEKVRFPASTERLTIGSFAYVLKSGEKLTNPGPRYSQYDFRFKSFAHSKPWNQRAMYGQPSLRMRAAAQYDIHVTGGVGNSVSVDYDSTNNRAYVASAISAGGGDYPGQLMAPMTEAPIVTPTSLAGFMHFRLNPGDTRNYASGQHLWDISSNDALSVGSSFANPMLPSTGIHQDVPDAAAPGAPVQMKLIRDFHDHVFLLNDGLWDRWFCSGITSQRAHPYGKSRTIKTVAEEFLEGNIPLGNSHYVASIPSGSTARNVTSDLFSGALPQQDTHKRIAQYVRIQGAFNVNSTSVEAWKTLLGGLRDSEIRYIDPESGSVKTKSLSSKDKVVISRFTLPCSANEGRDAGDPNSWMGVRLLDESQIDRLARECVRQVKLRGPFLNMSDFVCRRLDSGETGLCGALQAAIDWDEYNGNSPQPDNESINGRYKGNEDLITPAEVGAWRLLNPRAGAGSRWTAIPGYVTQADILKRIGNNLTARDDTFRIRAYGEATDISGAVLARAWCEVVVSRGVQYVDSADQPDVVADALTSSINQSFGRKINILSFRWLGKEEI